MNTGETIALIKAFGNGGGGSSGGGVLVIHETVSGSTHTLNKTWQEIHDSDCPVLRMDTGDERMFSVAFSVSQTGPNEYTVSFDGVTFKTDSASGYPSSTVE